MPEQQMNEEQVQELQEKVKNMSPEELKEFQKKQCIFCHIISGKVQAKKIFEDDRTLAVLDINPANPGHILLLPKEHYAIMPQLPEDELIHIFMVAKSLSNTALKSLEASGTNIIVANGPAAGQKAQHFMVHIIPRKENDNLSFSVPQQKIPEKDLDVIKDKLSKKLGSTTPTTTMPKQEIPPTIQRLEQKQEEPQKEEKVVEAEFKETPKEVTETEFKETPKEIIQPQKVIKKRKTPKKPKKKAVKKPIKKEPEENPPKQEPDEPANLDDIANILGVK